MENKENKNIKSLSLNRAEEFGFDLSNEFVIPPIFKQLDLKNSTKSKVFIGGRGCGKTMLLRYLSHRTMFSKTKSSITDSDLKVIGLYWKFDTNVTHLIQKRGLDKDRWYSAFEHLATINLCLEVINSLKSVAKSNYDKFSDSDFFGIELNEINEYYQGLPINIAEFERELKKKQSQFQIWLRNVRKGNEPLFLPRQLLIDLIKQLKAEVNCLSNSIFFIYLDEYENLLEYQQKIVNTWVKHSEKPVVFHLAMKRNAFVTKETIGNETLSNVHDFRYHDLEEDLENNRNFMIFSGEILLFRLSKQGLIDLDLDLHLLQNPDLIEERSNIKYQNRIIEIVEKMFPSMGSTELGKIVKNDKVLRKKLTDRLEKGLKNKKSDLHYREFILEEDFKVSVVCPSLLYRNNLTPEYILEEINKLKNNEPNDFYGSREWVKNSFIGSYLILYYGLNRACPFYSGFKAFCLMSNGNIRHLMELCHRTFIRSSEKNSLEPTNNIWQIDSNSQAQAARQASNTFLNEIRAFGRYGNQLHTFVLRLGALFQAAHKRNAQSEPEQNHFSIVGGSMDLEDIQKDFLNEVIKWSVLFETESTKIKNPNEPELTQYILNPIYSAYFHISYRKIRKIEITTNDFITISSGSLEDYELLFKRYKTKWNLHEDDNEPNLFSDLNV